MFEQSDEDQEVSYWPSVSDIFMTLFIIAMVLLASFVYLMPVSNVPSQAVIDAVGGVEMARIRRPTNRMRQELQLPDIRPTQTPEEIVVGLHNTSEGVISGLQELRKQLEEEKLKRGDAEKALKLAQDKPPIIKLTEGDSREYRFDSGSAALSDAFLNGLKSRDFVLLAGEITKRNQPGGPLVVDTLEIIGHTDGMPVRRTGNLDSILPWHLAGDQQAFGKLSAGSNNDLGLLRALAIKTAWRDFVAFHDTKDVLQLIEVRCYSAGQTLPDDTTDDRSFDPGRFLKENPKSRRIELRLTKLRD